MRATQDGHGTSTREGAGREAQGRTAQAGAAGRGAIPDGGGGDCRAEHGRAMTTSTTTWHAMHTSQDESHTRWA